MKRKQQTVEISTRDPKNGVFKAEKYHSLNLLELVLTVDKTEMKRQ